MRQRIAAILISICLLVGVAAVRAQSDEVNLLLTTLPAGRDPQRYKGYVEPHFKAFAPRNFYLPMRDGVKIAVQVVLPKDLPADQKLPAVIGHDALLARTSERLQVTTRTHSFESQRKEPRRLRCNEISEGFPRSNYRSLRGNKTWGGHGGPPLQMLFPGSIVGVALCGHPFGLART